MEVFLVSSIIVFIYVFFLFFKNYKNLKCNKDSRFDYLYKDVTEEFDKEYAKRKKKESSNRNSNTTAIASAVFKEVGDYYWAKFVTEETGSAAGGYIASEGNIGGALGALSGKKELEK